MEKSLNKLREEKVNFTTKEKIDSLVFSAEEELIRTGYYKHYFKSHGRVDKLLKEYYLAYFSSIGEVFIKETYQYYEDLNLFYDEVVISLEDFEKEDNKGCWLFSLMFVVFIIICVLLIFLTRG